MSNNNTNDRGVMRHAKVTFPKPTVHSTHPYRHAGNHQELLEYLQQRLAIGKDARDQVIDRYVTIDKKVAGWIRHSGEDAKRKRKQDQDGKPVMTDIVLPLTFVQLDDMMTYLAETFSPTRGMFYHTGNPNEVGEADSIVTKMNNDALYDGYYPNVLRTLFSLLKYNLGGFHVAWGQEYGPKLEKSATGRSTFSEVIQWAGNRLQSIDMYNFLPDPSVTPDKLHTEGEFAATVSMRSHFWLQRRAARGIYFNVESAIENMETDSNTATYYRHPPEEAQFESGNDQGETNWVSIMSGIPEYLADGHEIVKIYIRLNPTEFGLVEASEKATRNQYEIWCFEILNDQHIIYANHVNNIHGHIPMYVGMIHDDSMGTSQKAVSELLTPLQDFASALLNLHIKASRGAIWGTTFYDPSRVDLDSIPEGESAARVPIKAAGFGQDIRSMIHRDYTNLDTKQTMQDVESVMGIINQFFPTQALPSQIASIDRAVTNQVAAVQQGANRRQQKTARIVDASIFRNVRYAMYYNILQYQEDQAKLTDFYSGREIEFDLSKIRDSNLPFIIGQGLKAIDRTAAASLMQDLIFAMIQAPGVGERVDILGLANYWTDMLDVEIDLNQFRLDQQPTAEAAPTAEDPGVNPATNPQQFTAPVFGSDTP